ncbi:E3 ubiquitin-protein ligase ORTHRUS 1-like [Cucurbita moschata]|uniref:RING-type E3 ubiquitin transferase n=1 Tax=Cucurbita moschata TaxID=3662 RepID=A0A6J1F9B4_CUCMO|nr:E3 ubiquitin-protein ligase ORTHRUS 1-like [Cucurbita moschata]XP_022934995.1 E3 ubiquitin-protein ligase ORTHRUS 1-like [Cucurbita moschata]
MVQEGSRASASEPERRAIESRPLESGNDADSFFSPRFKSAAAMAGWDEEALLIASLVVDDTPEREFQQKKRSVLHCKSPTSGSRRKRRTSTSIISIPVAVLDLDAEEPTVRDDATKQDPETAEAEPKKSNSLIEQKAGDSSLSCSTLPCIDKLREELSCAICLEICFEPSTTPCGHSFCKKCLRSAADRCGKRCPKCRQLISNGRSCTVNTVLWNTIQLLFPQEVEARKVVAKECSSHEKKVQDPENAFYSSLQNHNTQATDTSSRRGSSSRRRGEITVRDDEDGERDNRVMQQAASLNAESRVPSRMHRKSIRSMRMTTRDADVSSRRGTPDQDQDAALALRLQREEFMEAFRDTPVQTRRSSLSLARANLRAMASRAAVSRHQNL